MTTRGGSNSLPSGSPGGNPPEGPAWAARLTEKDELELLALIEGDLTPAQEHAAILRWQHRPEVLAFLEHAVGDRLALGSAPETSVPPGLLNAVEAVLERDALVADEDDQAGAEFSTGIEHGTLVSARPPEVRLGAARGGWTIGARYAAMAATLLLAVGSAAYIMRANTRPASVPAAAPPGAERDLAQNAPSESSSGSQIAMKSAANEAAQPLPDEIARGEHPRTDHTAIDAAPTLLATASAADGEMTTERAIELARAGRLMVRVVTGSVDRTLAKVRDGSDRRLADVVSCVDTAPADASQIASAAETLRPLAGRDTSMDLAQESPTAFAGDHFPADASEAPRSVRPARSEGFKHHESRRAVARVDLQLSPQAIESLRAALETRGSAVVQLVELPEPMAASATFDPDQALWWTQPPSAWAPRVGVPVVFEQP